VFESRNKPYRYFLNDGLTQNAYDFQTRQGLGSWIYLLHDLACAYTTNVNDVLVIGLGVGIVPTQFAQEGARVDVVEINPAVEPLARQYFDLQPERMNITLGDGRQFVAESRKRYDVIVLDAFLGDSTPSHLMTREAFAAMRRILRPDGVLVINCWGSLDAGKDFLVASMQKTLAQVSSGIQIRCREEPGKVVNVFFVASPQKLTLWRPPNFDRTHPDSRKFAEETFARIVEADITHGVVLTDDFNPVDYHDAANREQSRRAMVASMQAVAREGSMP
jgi:spermidine synthase